MRLKRRPAEDDSEEVSITPLIDCVFLLIIFFLVTSMFKKFEMLIPLEVPDNTSSISREATDATARFGIDLGGRVNRAEIRPSGQDIRIRYRRIDDFTLHLKELAETQGTDTPLEFSVAHGTPVQAVIDTLDIAQLQGFANVAVRTQPEVRQR